MELDEPENLLKPEIFDSTAKAERNLTGKNIFSALAIVLSTITSKKTNEKTNKHLGRCVLIFLRTTVIRVVPVEIKTVARPTKLVL